MSNLLVKADDLVKADCGFTKEFTMGRDYYWYQYKSDGCEGVAGLECPKLMIGLTVIHNNETYFDVVELVETIARQQFRAGESIEQCRIKDIMSKLFFKGY